MLRMMLLVAYCVVTGTAIAEDVTVDNFVRAESDTMIRANMQSFGGSVGEFIHIRQPTTPDNQPVIRMNQDTLYSGIVLDLSKPVKIILPDTGERYISMHVVSQDHYMSFQTEPGTYELTKDSVGTRFALVTIRIFADPNDPEDIKEAHAVQDALIVEGGGTGPFKAPNWDQESLGVARKALSDLATLGFDSSYAYGSKDEVRPIDYLVGAAAGWGGLPRIAAMYVIDRVADNDGMKIYTLNVKEVPVDAFWSVTVYNADGYLEANKLGVNSLNNITAQQNDDGSYTIQFGGCDIETVNCIPISPGWNYTVRLYSPRKTLLDGTWAFPELAAKP